MVVSSPGSARLSFAPARVSAPAAASRASRLPRLAVDPQARLSRIAHPQNTGHQRIGNVAARQYGAERGMVKGFLGSSPSRKLSAGRGGRGNDRGRPGVEQVIGRSARGTRDDELGPARQNAGSPPRRGDVPGSREEAGQLVDE